MEAAKADHQTLFDLLEQAPPGSIWVVRDPDKFGNVDRYGREIAWLWVNGSWYYFAEDLHPTDY